MTLSRLSSEQSEGLSSLEEYQCKGPESGEWERRQEVSVGKVEWAQGSKPARGLSRAPQSHWKDFGFTLFSGSHWSFWTENWLFKKDESACSVENTVGLKYHGRKSSPFARASTHQAAQGKLRTPVNPWGANAVSFCLQFSYSAYKSFITECPTTASA